jgi:hypothetical protein
LVNLVRAISIIAVISSASLTARADLTSVSSHRIAAVQGCYGDYGVKFPEGYSSTLGEPQRQPTMAGMPPVDQTGAQPGVCHSGNPYARLVDRRTESDGQVASVVRQLPDPPSGVSLLISGLLTVGAFNLARSVRHVQFSALPEWYHAACPDRIGFSVPFELDSAVMLLSHLDLPANDRPDVHFIRPEASVWRLTPQGVLTPTAPRAPPTIS